MDGWRRGKPKRTFFFIVRRWRSGFSQPATATMTPAYLVAARVAAHEPGPARATLTLLRRTAGTVHE
jgi:hypothetical protein